MAFLVTAQADLEVVQASADGLNRDNVESPGEAQAMAKRSRADRIAAFVASCCGSMPVAWLHVLIFCSWLAWN